MLMRAFNSALTVVNRFVLRFNKEKNEKLISLADLFVTLAKHDLNHKFKKFAKLVVEDNAVPLPLPDRWTNDDKSKSMQSKFLTVMQLAYAKRPATAENASLIESAKDRSWTALNLLETSYYTRTEDFQTVSRAREAFNPATDKQYSFSKELLVGESIVNGENPYVLRKFNSGKITYDFEESKGIEEQYRNEIRNAFQRETLDQSVIEKAGLSKDQLQKAIAGGSETYSIFLEHLEKLTGGQPLSNSPEIFYGNQTLSQEYFLQSGYPVFLKSKNKSGDSEGFILVGIAFRYNKGSQVSVFSPFFSKQPYKCWKLAQAHFLSAYYNDFHMRVHLGTLHLTTNQYNVPIYNSLRRIGNASKSSKSYSNLKNFLQNAYTFFNEGLEGVNVNGQATLINPQPSFSIINKVFNYSQKSIYGLMAGYSNQLNIAEFNPKSLLAKNGLSEKEGAATFDEVNLDLKLTNILAEYIQKVYQIFEIDSVSEVVLKEISQETPNMAMGGARVFRNAPKNSQQLLKYFQNFAFAWVCFHAHTWSAVPFGQYYSLRPTMLSKIVPNNPQKWSSIEEGSQLPHPKVIMSALQVIGAVCGRDLSNLIIDKLKRHLWSASYAALTATNEAQKVQYEKLEAALNTAIKQLNDFGKEVQQTNARRAKKNQPILTWMDPTFMEASLNI